MRFLVKFTMTNGDKPTAMMSGASNEKLASEIAQAITTKQTITCIQRNGSITGINGAWILYYEMEPQ